MIITYLIYLVDGGSPLVGLMTLFKFSKFSLKGVQITPANHTQNRSWREVKILKRS